LSAVWSAVHRSDTARLIRLGIEKAPAGTRLHAVAEENIPTRTIAEAIGQALGLPVTSVAREDADEHFGFVASFFATTMTASSERTPELLGWTPTGRALVEDIQAGAYSNA
jgi:nucleoside-diphosphate-sugar epimerase